MTIAAGSRLGPYEILSPLGAGGMGEVWKARDTRLDRVVAIKVLPPRLSSDPEFRRRFEREARAISQLSHPSICTLYDVGREGDIDYLVMEYLEGETLAARIAAGALPLDQTLRLGAQIAEALERAHRAGIVHRDLKPSNVMLTKGGVKLLDFGLARKSSAAGRVADLTSAPTDLKETELTGRGAIAGTLQYMAPEQLEGKEADPRTDVFAFGALLYEMATGRKAFTGSSQASLITAIMSSSPPPIESVRPMAPALLDRIVRRCLARDPDERWQSAADVAAALLKKVALSGGPPQAICDSSSGSTGTWGPDGVILFNEWASGRGGILRVSADGGSPALAVKPDDPSRPPAQGWPEFLPDGRRFLFLKGAYNIGVAGAKGVVCLGSLDSPDVRPLFEADSRVEYAPPGYLLFVREGALLARPFDVERLAFTGDAIPVASGILYYRQSGSAVFSVSADGSTLAYQPHPFESRLVWLDSAGQARSSLGAAAVFQPWLRLSPDGRRVAMAVHDTRTGIRDVWFYDAVSGLPTRLTFELRDGVSLVWSPDGSRLAFGAGRKGPLDIYVRDLASGREAAVVELPGAQLPSDWSPDGARIAYRDYYAAREPPYRIRIHVLGTVASAEAPPATPFGEFDARFSPDGRWMSLVSEESGYPDVYVVPAARGGERRRVSSTGASRPRWRRDGRELYFLSADGRLMAVAVSAGSSGLELGEPRVLFTVGPSAIDFDVAPDGRFLPHGRRQRRAAATGRRPGLGRWAFEVTLTTGSRLGPYEILTPLGAGGMGEVYRARDTRLDRIVAIKVLPSHLSSAPGVRQRFEREAKTISQLSHPHICALYDVGREGETEYLVMELLEGETLAGRLVKGPLPLEQTLRYGIEIADALDKAHRQGIVHRDLKPGNVMLTSSGVKLLDFGLAKALGPTSSASVLTALPTETPLTEKGSILGTVQYMSPEQLEGREADARTDIFALGSVLYEMATGKKPFSGASQASLIGSILRDEPQPISRVQPMTPPALDRVVKTCLAKDRDDRWQTAHDVRLQLQWIAEGGSQVGLPAPVVVRRRSREWLAWGLVAVLCVALAAALAFGARRRQVEQPRTVRAFIPPPGKSIFHFAGEANAGPVTISPDGRRLAFVAADPDGRTQLWVHPLDALEAFPIPRTENAYFPFWSPDSRFLGFFANGKLKTIEASDSPAPPRVLADVFEGRGGSWSADGTILYSPGQRAPIYRVSSGGKPAAVTKLDEKGRERSHRWPLFLPDGRRFLYSVRFTERTRNEIYAGSLDSEEKTFVLEADSNLAFASGRLLFRQGDRLLAALFDAKTLAIAGEPLPVAERVEYMAPTGGSIFSASGSVLAYSAQGEGRLSRLVWLDRTGKEVGTVGPPANYANARLSPDRTRVALSLIDPKSSAAPKLWIYEVSRGTGTQLTYGVGVDLWPVWSPDGDRLVFASARGKGQWDLYEKKLPETGEERLLLESVNNKFPDDFSPDGQFLLYEEFDPRTNHDIKVLPLTGDRRPRAFVATPFEERNAQFSPDGRWVAYVSEEPGRPEVYLAAFPEGARRRVSTEGGSEPRWSADGRELFYVAAGRKLAAISVETRGGEPVLGQSRTLFQMPPLARGGTGFGAPPKYDVSPDGRFLVHARVAEEAPSPITLVLNWTAALRK